MYTFASNKNIYPKMKLKSERLDALKKLLSSSELSSQNEVLEALAQHGFHVTQATLSRDMKQLKVAKAATMGGSYVYVLPNDTMYRRVRNSAVRIKDKSSGLVSLAFSDNIAVLKTRPGYAGAVAYDIDNSNLPEVLGTIAGDDTIVIVLADGVSREQATLALSSVVAELAEDGSLVHNI